MDKWKDIELQKMKVGGNRKAREFLDQQDDWNDMDPINKRYNSLGAALYRDRISTLAQGQDWNLSEAKKRLEKQNSSTSHNMSHSRSTGALGSDYHSESYQDSSSGFQDSSSGYQQYNTPEFKDRKENYFNKIQMQNASRPDHLPPSQGMKKFNKFLI
jgi:ADP-ribosylation factor GTPase-activating protein 1